MFVCSMKFSKEKVAFCGAVILIAAAVWGLTAPLIKDRPAEQAVSGPVTSAKVRDNTQRVEYLEAYGWEVQEEPESIVEIVIPEEFNKVFQQYNEVQKLQGFDLEKQKGKRVRRYTYVVTNYPTEPDYIRANMLVRKDKVVGGDICSLKADGGFLHGFLLAQDTIRIGGRPEENRKFCREESAAVWKQLHNISAGSYR